MVVEPLGCCAWLLLVVSWCVGGLAVMWCSRCLIICRSTVRFIGLLGFGSGTGICVWRMGLRLGW